MKKMSLFVVLLVALAVSAMGQEKKADTYKVMVDYDQSLDEAIKAGKYDYVSLLITSENFPSPRKDETEVEVRLFHFGRTISSNKEAIAEMDRQGYRPATLRELLELVTQHPEFIRKKEFFVLALGSTWNGRVPVLRSSSTRRDLVMRTFEYASGDERYLPAVCK